MLSTIAGSEAARTGHRSSQRRWSSSRRRRRSDAARSRRRVRTDPATDQRALRERDGVPSDWRWSGLRRKNCGRKITKVKISVSIVISTEPPTTIVQERRPEHRHRRARRGGAGPRAGECRARGHFFRSKASAPRPSPSGLRLEPARTRAGACAGTIRRSAPTRRRRRSPPAEGRDDQVAEQRGLWKARDDQERHEGKPAPRASAAQTRSASNSRRRSRRRNRSLDEAAGDEVVHVRANAAASEASRKTRRLNW